LALAGFRVLLIGRVAEKGERFGETLGARARTLLQKAGIWEDFLEQVHRPSYAERSAWGGAEVRERSAMFNPYGTSFHLDRTAFERWLLDHCSRAGVDLWLGATLAALGRGVTGDWDLHIREVASRVSVSSKMLIDATGHAASVVRRLGERRHHLDRLVAIATWYEAVELEPITLVEAVELGWWYSVPLPDGRAVAVLMTDAESLGPRSARDRFRELMLRSAPLTSERFRRMTPLGLPRQQLCGPAVSDWRAIPNFAPVGDAAAAFDPLSGDGLCFALDSAARAAAALGRARHGDTGSLLDYRTFVHDSIQEHARARHAYYALERRWPTSGFWQRRLQCTGSTSLLQRASCP
jgi:flavin-dependent dehydrogenase